MAEKTNVGVAVFVADNTSMCGFESNGVAALLSACTDCPLPQLSFCLPLSWGVVSEHSTTLCDQLQGPPRT